MTWSKSPNAFGEEEREDSWREAGGEREVGDTILVYQTQKRHCANEGYQRRAIVVSPSTPDTQGQSHSLSKTVVETPLIRKQGRGAASCMLFNLAIMSCKPFFVTWHALEISHLGYWLPPLPPSFLVYGVLLLGELEVFFFALTTGFWWESLFRKNVTKIQSCAKKTKYSLYKTECKCSSTKCST